MRSIIILIIFLELVQCAENGSHQEEDGGFRNKLDLKRSDIVVPLPANIKTIIYPPSKVLGKNIYITNNNMIKLDEINRIDAECRDIINKSLGNGYDLLINIMGNRKIKVNDDRILEVYELEIYCIFQYMEDGRPCIWHFPIICRKDINGKLQILQNQISTNIK